MRRERPIRGAVGLLFRAGIVAALAELFVGGPPILREWSGCGKAPQKAALSEAALIRLASKSPSGRALVEVVRVVRALRVVVLVGSAPIRLAEIRPQADSSS
jgi:hypothetical protein